jgi:hypothetical protein
MSKFLSSYNISNLPKLQKRAQDGLNQNKDTMEKIMHSSSLVLSKKIKAFEKKYVETYLQDRTRIEDCAETLEELFKRSSNISNFNRVFRGYPRDQVESHPLQGVHEATLRG